MTFNRKTYDPSDSKALVISYTILNGLKER